MTSFERALDDSYSLFEAMNLQRSDGSAFVPNPHPILTVPLAQRPQHDSEDDSDDTNDEETAITPPLAQDVGELGLTFFSSKKCQSTGRPGILV
jgi:hypothetical protein